MLSLWDYAVASYGAPGVADTLLKLQDRHRVGVQLVLWALWCGRYGFSFPDQDIHELIGETDVFARHTTERLRSVRRYLKTPKAGFAPDDLQRLREDVLRIELKSEELVMRRLDDLTRQAGEPNETLGDFAVRSERLFTLARERMDIPSMIADESSGSSPLGLFRKAQALVEEHGP
ncbi:MAG: TIGR02444 family protein [Parvularcula sp.]|jgi:uncharacterized protein (TIGR02444 family)|nr:TIGR02444 family protein [Parvularcula sp.]